MSSQLESKVDKITKEFFQKAKSEISSKTYYIKGKPKGVKVTKQRIVNSVQQVCSIGNSQKVTLDMIDHFEYLEKLLPFCSSPKAFRTAWDMRSNILNKYDADLLANQGAQLNPNNKNLRIFQAVQQGVELGKNKRLVTFVRHSEGNYEDELDNLGRFTYQPPTDVTGMIRYRWCQFLSKKLQIPYVVIVVMWFEHRVSNSSNLVFIAAPAQIIKFDGDLKNLGKSLSKPVTLQLINRTDAYDAINLLNSLNQTAIHNQTRTPLQVSLAREFSFPRINSSAKGKSIKRWAKKRGLSCPGTLCNHVKFDSLPLNQIAFGHIISQEWIRSFTFLLNNKDHPDNLYLTCQRCNSSLGENFPDRRLKEQIEKMGTIGDWLRKDSNGIRKA